MKNVNCSEMNVIDLLPKKWIILHTKCYAEYENSDHTQKIFISFEYTVSFDRSGFTLLN